MKVSGFKMNRSGMRAVMESPRVQAMLLSLADGVKSEAESSSGCVYEADVSTEHTHGNKRIPRAHAMVKTTDAASRADNLTHNTLLKAFGAAGVKTAKTKGSKMPKTGG